jgi:hypothetical protein
MSCTSRPAAPCRYLPLIVYNLENGISGLVANGQPATRNSDNGQQWIVTTSAIVLNGQVAVKQNIEVTVIDVDGHERGTYTVPLDPVAVKAKCATGAWASPAPVKGGPNGERLTSCN